MERGLCLVWAGWCRGGDWDARRKRGEGGGLAWLCWWDRMGVLYLLILLLSFSHLRWVGQMLAIWKRKSRLHL